MRGKGWGEESDGREGEEWGRMRRRGEGWEGSRGIGTIHAVDWGGGRQLPGKVQVGNTLLLTII